MMPSSQQSVSAKRRFPENRSELLLLVQPQTRQYKFLIHRYRNLDVIFRLPSRQYPKTLEGSGGEHSVDNRKSLQQKRDCNLDI